METPAAGEIRVLGWIDIVRDDGGVVALPAKERRLLAALAAAPGATRTSDGLVDALWGASPPRSAPKLVQVYVSKLRKVLPAGAQIRSRDSGYALELVDGTLDAARFEHLLAEARDVGHEGDPSLVAARLRRALALWRGEAYGELAGEEFAHAEARRLEELRLVALEDRMEAELELGRQGELIPELRALAAAEPLRERLQAQLMRALYRAGNQAEALEVYAHARAKLVELGLEPGAELRELQRGVLQQDASLSPAPAVVRAAGSLPSPPNSLLGRERELLELAALLRRDEVRLLVLTGAGGSGKTRLALEAAREAAGAFANGTVLVELAPVQDPALLLDAIARALGVDQVGGDPLEQLVAALRRRELLLLLDNLEHLRAGAPRLAELIRRAPGAKLLVTSRVVLHLSGEHVYPVAPLREEAAVALFLERAEDADARFELDADDDGAIAALCRRVDGLPLAIELAAGRVRTRTPAELLAALEQRLPLLTGGPRDLPARQQTLRATLEWSVDLLDDAERRDLARLSVFPARFSLESAEAVCDTTLERLSALVDHNLLVRTVTLHGSRYSMLETIRELAAEHLDGSGEDAVIRRRHVTRLLDVAREAHFSEDADEPFHWPAALAEADDLRAALEWATEHEVVLAFELAGAWENYWGPHAPAEGVRRIRRLLDRAADGEVAPVLRARALRNLAGAAHQERDFAVAEPAYEESLRIFTELGDVRGAASIRMRLAYIARWRGDDDRMQQLLDESLRDANGRFPMIEIQGALLRTHAAVDDGRFDDADLLLRRCEELRARFAWRWYDTVVASLRMWIALGRGQFEEAESSGREALAIHVEENHAAATTVSTIAGLAHIALATGRLERAGLLWGAALEHGEEKLGGHTRLALEAARAETRPAFLEASARGRRLDVHEAAALGLDGTFRDAG